MTVEDQRFLMPCGPSTDQGDELPRAWEAPSVGPQSAAGQLSSIAAVRC
jgi:hypothetical protein